MTNFLSNIGLTRDSARLGMGLFVSVIAYLAGNLGLLNQAFGSTWGARVTLTAGVLSIVFAYLRISPLRLSPGSELAGTKDPAQTLTITGKLPMVLLALGLAGGLLAGCGGKTPPRDLSQLSAQGRIEYTADQVVKIVNDATDAVIAANRSGVLRDDVEQKILTINKQVLDVVRDNPSNWRSLAISAIRNARQALPPNVDALVGQYLASVIGALQEVK